MCPEMADSLKEWLLWNAVLGSEKDESRLQPVSKIKCIKHYTHGDAKPKPRVNFLGYFLLPTEGAAALLPAPGALSAALDCP